MKEYINQWLQCEILYYKDVFQVIDNLHFVHPIDRDFVQNNLTNTLYQCVGTDEDYLLIKSNKYTLRIKSDAIKRIFPSPKFMWNDIIITQKHKKGKVLDLFWHEKYGKYYYMLEIEGQKDKKRYEDKDFFDETTK